MTPIKLDQAVYENIVVLITLYYEPIASKVALGSCFFKYFFFKL